MVQGESFFVNWADFPSLVELPNGQWLVHWLQRTPPRSYAYHVKLAISGDHGVTWSKPFSPHRDISPTEHGFVSMVPWEHGAALIWLDGRAMTGGEGADHGMGQGAMTIRFTTLDADGKLGEETLLDDRTCECCQTALVRTSSGLMAAYRDRSETELRNIAITQLAGGSWSEPAPVHDDGWHFPGCPVNGPSLSAAGDTVAIAWFTAPEEQRRVSVAFSTDAGATWGAPIRVDDGRPVGRVDLEMLADGSALVSWLESRRQGAEVLA
ncbi:MAG: exo-alpha-sialidase, partial [Gemmatimonadetes bacterium]|nr:exo-alpha-sialidase [Gemmatimonadota bacterium]